MEVSIRTSRNPILRHLFKEANPADLSSISEPWAGPFKGAVPSRHSAPGGRGGEEPAVEEH